MIKLAVAITLHPAREHRLPKLLADLSPCDDVHVEIDRVGVGPWPQTQKCWRSLPSDASHLLILQDDVVLCRDFYISAVRALRHQRNVPVGFYANHKNIDSAREKGVSWAKISGGVWGQAQCLPRAYVKAFLEWEERTKPYPDQPNYDDRRLGDFLKERRIPVRCTVPSLVEHGCPSDSLIGYSNKRRVARWFIGEDVSGLSVDWRLGG